MSVESELKQQYSKVFRKKDYRAFKIMADYYLKNAAIIKKKDINIDKKFRLMGRNIQKRLFIGIGVELLLKAVFIKNGFCINRVKKNQTPDPGKPQLFYDGQDLDIINANDTYSLNYFIDNFNDVIELIAASVNDETLTSIRKGLIIAKIFRNKEGHVAVFSHVPDLDNYLDIENSIINIYKIGFNERLKYKISFKVNQKSKFKIH